MISKTRLKSCFAEIWKQLLNLKPAWLIILLIPFYALVSCPLLDAGFYQDDWFLSLTKGELQLSHTSLWQFCEDLVTEWVTKHGRLFPLALIAERSFFYIFYDQFFYQIARSVAIFLSLLTFAWLLKLLTKKLEIGILFLFLAPLFWSVQNFSDSLTSYGILLPQVASFSILAVCFYIKYEQRDRKIFLILSLLMLLCGLLTYEIAVTSFFVIASITWAKKKSCKDFLSKIFPYFLLILSYLTLTFALRHKATAYDGVTFGSIKAIPSIFLQQVTATLPLNNFLFEHVTRNSINFSEIYLGTISLFLISFFSLYRLLPQLSLDKDKSKLLVIIGSGFLFIPAFLVSLSAKYQNSLFDAGIGYGYLPMYLQYIGLCALYLVWHNKILHNFLDEKRALFNLIFSLLLSAAICFSVELNREMVTYNNKPYYNLRALTTSALQSNLLSSMPKVSDINSANPESFSADVIFFENATNSQRQNFLLKAKKYPSIASPTNFTLPPSFFAQNANLIVNLIKVKIAGGASNFSVKNIPDTDQIFLIDPVLVGDLRDGYVIFGKLNSASYNSDHDISITSYTISNPRIFIQNESGQFFAEIAADLQKRFLSGSLPQINISRQNHLMIELPDGHYQINSKK